MRAAVPSPKPERTGQIAARLSQALLRTTPAFCTMGTPRWERGASVGRPTTSVLELGFPGHSLPPNLTSQEQAQRDGTAAAARERLCPPVPGAQPGEV